MLSHKETNFHLNNKENTNGENYLDRALGGQPDLQRRVRTIIEEIQPRIDAIDAEFATKYGWTRNEQINSAHRRGDSDVEGRIEAILLVYPERESFQGEKECQRGPCTGPSRHSDWCSLFKDMQLPGFARSPLWGCGVPWMPAN